MSRIILPRDIEVLITSYGGVGTTYLTRRIAKYKKTSRHLEHFRDCKHSPIPPISFKKNVKFVYVYGNPQLATISLFRRNFQHRQSIKLQRWIQRVSSPIPSEMTLQEYASQGVDKFHFRDHFYNWYDRYLSPRPTMFIRYETMFDNVAPLVDFLELPKKCIDGFLERAERASTLEGVSIETRKQLDHMYNDFSDELLQLDDVEIRQRTNGRGFAMTYLKRPYLNAIAQQSTYGIKSIIKKRAPIIFN